MISQTLYLNLCLTENAAVPHGAEDLDSKKIVQGPSKAGLESGPDPPVADATLEGMNARTREARYNPSFADSLVKSPEVGALELDRSAPAEARVDSRHLSGASFASETDTQPRAGKRDTDAETLRTRGTLRKQLTTKPGQSPWSILKPKPKFDASSFEDPVSDEFWTDIWVACAANNVSRLRVSRIEMLFADGQLLF